MSTCPGTTLEDFLMWEHDLIVDDDRYANVSLRMVEMMGQETRRIRISAEEFKPLVNIYNAERVMLEHWLDNFDEDNMSWRGYADSCPVSEDIEIVGTYYVNSLRARKTMKAEL